MKLVAILFSSIVFVVLLADFIEVDLDNSTSRIKTNVQAFNKPARLDNTLLEVENKWSEFKEKRNIKKPDTNKVDVSTKNILTIGDEEYVLYGIFSENTAPFILLKGKGENSIKLSQGDSLGKSFVLTEINHNIIVFTHSGERIEFKLFERNKHAADKKQ